MSTSVDEDVRSGKLYTDLSRVVTWLSQSQNGFSMPSFRRWRVPDAIAGVTGFIVTIVVAVVTLQTGGAQYAIGICVVTTAVAVVLLGRLPKFGPSALTLLRWRLEARQPRTSCTHAPAALAGRQVDPATGRLAVQQRSELASTSAGAGFLRRAWHSAPKLVVGNIRFTGAGVFAEYLVSTTDFFYRGKDDQDAVADAHALLYREFPSQVALSGLTVYQDPEQDACRGMLVAGVSLDARRRFLEGGAVGPPDLSTVSPQWFDSVRRHWLPDFQRRPLRYRQGWLRLRLDFGRKGDELSKNVAAALAGRDIDDPAVIEHYRRIAGEMAAAIPAVFEPRPAAAEQIWWHWNATLSCGAWREPLPDVPFDPDAVLDESAFTPAYFDENAAELYGPTGLSADNPLVRVYRDAKEDIPDSYQALVAIDAFPSGGLTFPRALLFKQADDLSSAGIVIDWDQDLIMSAAEATHTDMMRMDANLSDQWSQRGALAQADTELPLQLAQARDLATKCQMGSVHRGARAAILFRVAAESPDLVAAGVTELKAKLAGASVGVKRWRGSQKWLAHTFIPGAAAVSDVRKLRHLTTSDDMALWVALASSQLGDPFGVPLGIDITMPGMPSVALTDILGAPTRGKGPIMTLGGDPGRGKSNCAKVLNYSWALLQAQLAIVDPTQVREHERALRFYPDDKKLIIDAHRNQYSLDCVRATRFNSEILERLARQGFSDVDEDTLPQPTDHLLGLTGFAADSEVGRRFQKHVSAKNLAAKGIGSTRGLINYLRTLPPQDKVSADEHLLIVLEGLAADAHLKALFDEDLTVPDYGRYQIQIWNTAWLELPTSEETSSAHLHREMTPRQRAGRAIYGLAIDTIMQQFFSRPKQQSMLTVEECYDWIHSAAGGAAAYRLMTQGRKTNSGGLFVVQNPVTTFRRIGSEFITQRLNFGFKDPEMARQVLLWCGRDIDRHPDLLRQYTQDTSPVMRVNHRNRQLAHLHGKVVPGKEGQCWLLDEVDNFGKLQTFNHPDPRIAAAFDTNPLTAKAS